MYHMDNGYLFEADDRFNSSLSFDMYWYCNVDAPYIQQWDHASRQQLALN